MLSSVLFIEMGKDSTNDFTYWLHLFIKVKNKY